MIEPWYRAVEPFDPSAGVKWTDFVRSSGLTQLEELISFDNYLCPCVITDLTERDWYFNVDADYVLFFFTDLKYLLTRVAKIHPVNILAAIRNPDEECSDAWTDSRFGFKGYDVVDACADISALTNCGGFPKAFQNEELSTAGLIETVERANEIKGALQEHYPYEPHTDCDVWALWKMKTRSQRTLVAEADKQFR